MRRNGWRLVRGTVVGANDDDHSRQFQGGRVEGVWAGERGGGGESDGARGGEKREGNRERARACRNRETLLPSLGRGLATVQTCTCRAQQRTKRVA